MALKPSKRRTPPAPDVLERRRTWGGRLAVELNGIGRSPEWLGRKVGYAVPSSMRQVINGHQGVSREVYERILRFVPEMRGVRQPPITKERKGQGSPGPHKPHDYPKLGPVKDRRAT